MMMSTGGLSLPGTGNRGASHQSRHSGANMAANSRLTAYSGRDSGQGPVLPGALEAKAYVQMISEIAQAIAQPASTLSQIQRGPRRGTVVPRGMMKPVTVILVTTM